MANLFTTLLFGKCCCSSPQSTGDEQVFFVSQPKTFHGPQEVKRLQVPTDFSLRSVDNALPPGSGFVSLNEEQKGREMLKLQHMIRVFVTEFIEGQGVCLDAMLEDGSLVPCRCVMDSSLSTLTLEVHGVSRAIELNSVQEICAGAELRDLRVSTPLDEFCVTLVMTNDQCMSFKFPDLQARDHFSTCMKVLRLAMD